MQWMPQPLRRSPLVTAGNIVVVVVVVVGSQLQIAGRRPRWRELESLSVEASQSCRSKTSSGCRVSTVQEG